MTFIALDIHRYGCYLSNNWFHEEHEVIQEKTAYTIMKGQMWEGVSNANSDNPIYMAWESVPEWRLSNKWEKKNIFIKNV